MDVDTGRRNAPEKAALRALPTPGIQLVPVSGSVPNSPTAMKSGPCG